MSVNKVILIGNLTRDAEVRTVGQNQVAKFGLATSEKYRGSDGEVKEATEFHNIELWGNTGVYQYLRKGQTLFVEGSIRTEKYTGNDGQERTTVKIKAFTVQLVGARPQQSAPAAPQYAPQPAYPAYPTAPAAPAPRRAAPPVPPIPPAAPTPGVPQYAQQAAHDYVQEQALPLGPTDDLPF